MKEDRLFSLARTDQTIVVTPQRDLTEFNFAEIEMEAVELLGQISKDGGPNVVVDLSQIEYTGSTALAFFARLFKKTRCRGGEMVFCNVSEVERNVLEVTRLDTLWPICDSLDAALAMVRQSEATRSRPTWIVIANRSIARIFEQRRGTDGDLHPVTSLSHPESRERMSSAVADAAGSFRGGAIAGSESGEPNQDYEHHMAADFAREVATYLDGARQRGGFARLVLIAAPLFLGALRGSLSAPVQKLVEREVAKDYTHLDASEIPTSL